MLFRFVCIILLLGSFSALCAAEDSKDYENSFAISLGLSEYQTKEFVLNKVKHRGLFPSLAFDYHIPSEKSRQNITLNILFNPLASSYESEAATIAVRSGLNYSYL